MGDDKGSGCFFAIVAFAFSSIGFAVGSSLMLYGSNREFARVVMPVAGFQAEEKAGAWAVTKDGRTGVGSGVAAAVEDWVESGKPKAEEN